jgi:hypothetical protein
MPTFHQVLNTFNAESRSRREEILMGFMKGEKTLIRIDYLVVFPPQRLRVLA